MVIRVAVVDDDDVSRRGLVELLGEQPDVHVVAALTHLEAVTWTQRWDVVDVAIVDACDERRSDDQFPGVSVVEGIRARRSRDETRVIVRTGQFFDDAVRRRMREADADYFFHRSELQDVSALRAVVLHPERFRSGVPDVADPSGMLRLGVGRRCRRGRPGGGGLRPVDGEPVIGSPPSFVQPDGQALPDELGRHGSGPKPDRSFDAADRPVPAVGYPDQDGATLTAGSAPRRW
jgi:CheY-like chemotaxis protein